MSKLPHAWKMQLPQHMGSALLDNWKLLLHIFAMQHMSRDDHVGFEQPATVAGSMKRPQ